MPKVYREEEIEDLVAKLVDRHLRHAQFLNDTMTQSGPNALANGGRIATADTGGRVEITSGAVEQVSFYTGDGSEAANGQGAVFASVPGAGSSRHPAMVITAPAFTGLNWSQVTLVSESPDHATKPAATFEVGNAVFVMQDNGQLIGNNGYPMPQWSGPTQRTFHADEKSWTTSSSAGQQTATVTHGLVNDTGAHLTPVAVAVSYKGTALRGVTYGNVTATTFDVNVENLDGSNIASGVSLTVGWIAVG